MKTFRSRDEGGAIAVMFALMAVILLIVGALAVDLGNTWARKRAVQRQVDVAAISAGYLLPVTSGGERLALANAVVESMQQEDNSVAGQDLSAVTGATLISSGALTFQDNSGGTCASGAMCTQFTVEAPFARVDFGLAQVMGSSGTNVTREAVVRVESGLPRAQDTLPFWLPNGCSYGPAEPDTSGGGGPKPRPAPSWAMAGPALAQAAAAADPIVVSPVGTHSIAGTNYAAAVGASVTVSGLTVINVPSNTDRASIRFLSPDGATFVDFAVNESNPKGTLFVPTFVVSGSVTNTVGVWQVYALIQPNGANKPVEYSLNYLNFTVGTPTPSPTVTPTPTPTTATPTGTGSPTGSPSPTPTPTPTPTTASPTGIPVGCVGQDRGNFGQLESPRKDKSPTNQTLAYNIADGMDHELVPFGGLPATTISCEDKHAAGGFIPNAVEDSQARLDADEIKGRNCIFPDPGNDGPKIFDGFIQGTTSPTYPGRLDASVAGNETTCPGRSNVSMGGKSLNNDVLSCFLRGGATLGTIAQKTGVNETMLDPLVLQSPRFVWLPVVYANDRTVKEYQPILTFVPAFITNETQASTETTSDATCLSSTDCNGIEINGNSIEKFKVFTFNEAALPEDERSPTVDYDPALGNPIVRLVG